MSHGNRNLTQNIFQCHMENEISVKIFFNVTWKMKLLLNATFNITLLMGKYLVIFSLAKYLWSFATYLWMNFREKKKFIYPLFFFNLLLNSEKLRINSSFLQECSSTYFFENKLKQFKEHKCFWVPSSRYFSIISKLYFRTLHHEHGTISRLCITNTFWQASEQNWLDLPLK